MSRRDLRWASGFTGARQVTIIETIPCIFIADGPPITTGEGVTFIVRVLAITIAAAIAIIIEFPESTLDQPKLMSLFDTVLASLNDPSRGTQTSDLQNLVSAFEGGPASSTNTSQIASLIGGFLKPALQEQHATGGAQGVDSFLQDLKQSANSPDQLKAVLGADRVDQMVGRAEQRTGLDANAIFRLLPIILPAVIGLLQSGRASAATSPAAVSGATSTVGAAPAGHTNPILAQFLDSDGDGDVDMADVLRLSSRFLQK